MCIRDRGYTAKEMKHTFPLIAADFANIPVTRVPKVKVGVVGEIDVYKRQPVRGRVGGGVAGAAAAAGPHHRPADGRHPADGAGGAALFWQPCACLLYTSRCV